MIELPTEADPVKVVCGDALAVLRALPDGCVDAVITDPPYGVRDEEWDDMDAQEFARFSMAWLCDARRVGRELVAFGTNSGSLRSLCEMLWPNVRGLIWNKPIGSQYAGASERGLWFAHEAIWHCHHGMRPKGRETATTLRAARLRAGMSLGAVDIAIRGKKTGLAYRWEEASCLPTPAQAHTLRVLLRLGDELDAAIACDRESLCEGASAPDVFTFRTETSVEHPCQKPVGLMRSLVARLTQPGDLILDPFGGSGTAAVAALHEGRRCLIVEKDAGYCDIIRRRVAEALGEGKGSLFAPDQTLF